MHEMNDTTYFARTVNNRCKMFMKTITKRQRFSGLVMFARRKRTSLLLPNYHKLGHLRSQPLRHILYKVENIFNNKTHQLIFNVQLSTSGQKKVFQHLAMISRLYYPPHIIISLRSTNKVIYNYILHKAAFTSAKLHGKNARNSDTLCTHLGFFG